MEKLAAAIDTFEPWRSVTFKSSMTREVILSNCLGCSICYRTIVLGAIRLYLQVCLQVYTKRPQDTKEARVMALLLNLEVLGIPEMLRYESCPRYRTDINFIIQSISIIEIS